MPALQEPEPLTAEKIATNHFAKDLALHDAADRHESKTVVIVHDDCFGHKFSRLKSKDTVHMIVERPERMQAGLMGISAAYVRLGERHAGGRNPPTPKADPSKHFPFRIIRSSRKVPLHSEAVTAVHGKEWMKELQRLCDNATHRVPNGQLEVQREPNANGTPKDPLHSGDLYLCSESIDSMEGALGGVCDAVDAVFQGTASGKGPSQAFSCVRPPGHHCSSDWPSGFCWLNNVHVGIQHAVQNHGLTHAAIIDFDLHHGDGSQEITWEHNERMFFPKTKNFPNSKKSFLGYFSLHDINSFPCEAGDREKCQMASLCIDNAHGQAIWNVHLQTWQTHDEFWELYEKQYKVLIVKMRKFLKHRTSELQTGKNQPRPKAAIFISAGFDASEHEGGGMQRHSVNVLTEFYARFTRDIVELANEPGTSVEGRVISVLEGGYSDHALISGILSHISGLCEGESLQSENNKQQTNDGLAGQDRIGLSGLPATLPLYDNASGGIPMKYNDEWWHKSNLDTLVDLLHPSAPDSDKPARKPRTSTYHDPTRASALKIVDPNRVIRSTSFGSRAPSVAQSRATSPPPPDVNWATAASELCKLLIPKDREINSFTTEQLNPKDVKVKKEKVAEVVLPIGGPRRTLRERKARPSTTPSVESDSSSRKVSADRRRTIADLPPASTGLVERPTEARRRLSVASTVSTTSVAPATTARPRPSKPATVGVDVKKARVPSNTTASRTTSVKPAAAARVPSGVIKKEPSRSLSVSALPNRVVDADMDSLTSGLKRITIRVPSNEEYLARQKKALGVAEKPSTASSRTTTLAKKPAVARTAKAIASGPKKPSVRDALKAKTPSQTTTGAQKPLAPQVCGSTSHGILPRSASATMVEPAAQPFDTAVPAAPATTNGVISPTTTAPALAPAPAPQAVFPARTVTPPNSTAPAGGYSAIQWATPNGDVRTAAPTAAPQLEPNGYAAGLQWMPPNSDGGPGAVVTGSLKPSEVARKQKDVPLFSSTGHIPFGPGPVVKQETRGE
jgi:histone deacetylase HOS3